MSARKVAAAKIARAFRGGRWLKGYIQGKLSVDPIFETGLVAALARGGKVVDLGCGLGLFALWLRQHGCKSPYRGCDLDPWKIKLGQVASENLGYSDLSLSVCDATVFPLEGTGVICVFDMLHYLSKADQERMFLRLSEAARQGALILIRTGVRGRGWRSGVTTLLECWIQVSGWIRGGCREFPVLEDLTKCFESQGCLVESESLHGRLPFSSYLLRVSSLS